MGYDVDFPGPRFRSSRELDETWVRTPCEDGDGAGGHGSFAPLTMTFPLGQLEDLLTGEFLAQHGGVAGVGEADFEIDYAVADQFGDFAIEVLHAFGCAGLHGVEQRLAFAVTFFDALAGAGVDLQDFELRGRGRCGRPWATAAGR